MAQEFWPPARRSRGAYPHGFCNEWATPPAAKSISQNAQVIFSRCLSADIDPDLFMRKNHRRRLLRGPTLPPLAASGAMAADGVIAAGHHFGGDDVFHDVIMLLAKFLHFTIHSEMLHTTNCPSVPAPLLQIFAAKR